MGDVLKRIGWGLLALLFVVTGLGVGIYYFWQAVHQSNNDNQKNSQTNSCQFDLVSNSQTFSTPDVFKPSGDVTQLETTDLKEGTGTPVKSGDCLTVKYYGTLATDGKVFDEDFDKSQALKFPLGQGTVIPGWDQGLVGMKVGGTRRIVVPSELAYKDRATGSIPANSDLVFVVNLLSTN